MNKKILTLLAIIIIYMIAFSLIVGHFKENQKSVVLPDETKKEETSNGNTSSHIVLSLTSELVKAFGSSDDKDASSPQIEINISGTEEYYTNVQEEINKIVGDTNAKVTLKKKTKEEMRDEQWDPIMDSIRKDIEKEFDEIAGFAYSFYPEPLQITVKTNLHKPWFGRPSKKAEQIESYVHKIIKVKREELIVEEVPYEMTIQSVDGHTLN